MKKEKKKEINWYRVFYALALYLLFFALGVVVGENYGEIGFANKLAIVFANSDFDIDVDINETLLVQSVKDDFNNTIRDILDEKNLTCKTCVNT